MEEQRYGGLAVLRMSGPVDEPSATALRDRVVDWAAAPTGDVTAVVIDVTAASGISDDALECLHELAQRCEGRLAVRVVASGEPMRMLRAAGLADQLPHDTTLEEAMGALVSASEASRLREELVNRERQLESLPAIEQIKGILKQDFGLDDEHAVDFLRRLSQDSNVKLRELADRLVEELSGTASGPTRQKSLETIQQLRDLLRQQHAGSHD